MIAIAGGAWGVLHVRDDHDARDAVIAVADAGVAELAGRIEIDPDPGATGTITDASGARLFAFGPDHPPPMRVRANAKLHVHVERAGYKSFDDDITVAPGELVRVPAHLAKARAALHVVTQPAGAQVLLGDRVLGDTPLLRDDLDAQPNAELVVARAGFDAVRLHVDLVVGVTTEIDQTLKAAQRYGAIRVSVRNGWGDVYFKGARVGDSGGNAIRLPIGRQALHLKNPAAHKEWDATCDVDDSGVKLCMTQMP